jgi:electron transfer flavoprotein beta subunit
MKFFQLLFISSSAHVNLWCMLRTLKRTIVLKTVGTPFCFYNPAEVYVYVNSFCKGHAMKVLVPVKRVVDYNVKVRVKSDGSGVDIANVKMSMNPFDEIAVEEAVRLKEGGKVTEVIAVSAGVTQCQETLRTAMAIGADRGILVEVARCRTAAAGRGQAAQGPGRQGTAAADHPGQAGHRRRLQPDRPDAGCLAGLAASHLRLKVVLEDGKVTVTREVDGGLETLALTLPAIITTDLRLNEPRYVTLPNIMKAKKKQLDTVKPDELGVDVAPRVKT